MEVTTDTRPFNSKVLNVNFPHFVSVSLNGKPTSISCGHNHKRKELAEKCCAKTKQQWTDILGAGNWELIEIGKAYSNNFLYEIRYMAADGRKHYQRFYYL
jgi:hypothetical protein